MVSTLAWNLTMNSYAPLSFKFDPALTPILNSPGQDPDTEPPQIAPEDGSFSLTSFKLQVLAEKQRKTEPLPGMWDSPKQNRYML